MTLYHPTPSHLPPIADAAGDGSAAVSDSTRFTVGGRGPEGPDPPRASRPPLGLSFSRRGRGIRRSRTSAGRAPRGATSVRHDRFGRAKSEAGSFSSTSPHTHVVETQKVAGSDH